MTETLEHDAARIAERGREELVQRLRKACADAESEDEESESDEADEGGLALEDVYEDDVEDEALLDGGAGGAESAVGDRYARHPDRLRVTAIHLGGVANLPSGHQGIDLRLS